MFVKCIFLVATILVGQVLAGENSTVTGKEVSDLKPFDDLMLSFIAEHQVPGASLAITKNGKLIYARGFGFADAEKKEAVQPDALFRIASISKPITAVAVLQLVEQGKLKLDDTIATALNLQKISDERFKTVTILQLLQHSGGWDRSKSFDPMFRSVLIAKAANSPPPASAQQVIDYMQGIKLDFNPGERYAYSNFGYCLLGRAIEKVSGKPYDAYVRDNVFEPIGIKRIQLGRTLLENRATGEVMYYPRGGRSGSAVMGSKLGEKVPAAYGAWNLEAMDSHGGWISSAIDLVRFASAFDNPSACKILKSGSVQKMFDRPAAPLWIENGKPSAYYYGCGWLVRPVGNGMSNTWHNGRLDGTSTLLVRRHDGLCWAALFNSDTDAAGKDLSGDIDPLLHKAAAAVKNWPDIDLFEK